MTRQKWSSTIRRFFKRGGLFRRRRFEYPLKVLYIGSEDNIGFVRPVLEHVGLQMTTALDGQEGLELARLAQPDVIVLDELTPGMDGFKVFNEIKADKSLQQIPLVFLANTPIGESWSQPSKDVIEFPTGPRKLIDAIEMALIRQLCERNTEGTRVLTACWIGAQVSNALD